MQSGQQRGRTEQGWLSFISVKGTILLRPPSCAAGPDLNGAAAGIQTLLCVSDVAVTSGLEIDSQLEVVIARVVRPADSSARYWSAPAGGSGRRSPTGRTISSDQH